MNEGMRTSLSNSMGNKKIFYGLKLNLITDRNTMEWEREKGRTEKKVKER